MVTVADTGTGIPPDKLDSIFEMFTQIDRIAGALAGRPRHRLDAGRSGSCRCTADRSRRTARAKGRGSEFVVRLPDRDRARRRGGARPRAPRTSPRTTAASWSSTTTGMPPRRSPCCCRSRATRRSRAHDGAGGARGGGKAPPRSRPARYRPADAERLRSLPPHPRAAVGQRHGDHRAHRLGTGGGPAQVARRRLRRPPRQARGVSPPSIALLDSLTAAKSLTGTIGTVLAWFPGFTRGRACTPPSRPILPSSTAASPATRDGAVATYIPELAKADPDWFGICLVTMDGVAYSVGDTARCSRCNRSPRRSSSRRRSRIADRSSSPARWAWSRAATLSTPSASIPKLVRRSIR